MRRNRAGGYRLEVLAGSYAVCRVPDGEVSWAGGALRAVLRAEADAVATTVICDETTVPPGVESDRGWSALRLAGEFGFGEVGVLVSVLGPLAEARVPVLTVCTFETDYILIKAERLDRVAGALEEAGHEVAR